MVGHFLERSSGSTKGVTSTNLTLPPQSKRRHRRYRGRWHRQKPRSRPCLVPPPRTSLIILFNLVVAPNFVGNCMSLLNFAILFAVTQVDGYAAANWRRLILLRIRSVYLRQRRKRCRHCWEIDVVVSHSFCQKPFTKIHHFYLVLALEFL